MIEYTLALGNYLNGTSAKGGARGFKLEAAFSLKKHSGSRKQNLLKKPAESNSWRVFPTNN